jgi:NhaP-type Na+/H+ or K+/H+ antiporter
MLTSLVPKIAAILGLGVAAQWTAWRFQVPSIVLLAVAGLLAGPVTGLIDPLADFGRLLGPMVAVAVAVILFEGGMGLQFALIKDAAPTIRRLILFGGPVAWVLNAAAAYWVAGLSPPVAILFGGILVVTGPTVIAPLLRQARLQQRPAAVLQWEGIINDPIGALYAVLTYEFVVHWGDHGDMAAALPALVGGVAAAGALGAASGWGLAWAFRRGHVPEFLKAPVLLGGIIAVFAAANAVYDESGLVAVTAMGLVIGNSRIASLDELRRFKENVAVVLISVLFVVLAAQLSWDDVLALEPRHAAFVVVLLLVARPASVVLATLGGRLPWRERLLVAWIAPRGIVAVAISGLFAGKLAALGHAEGALLVPLAFAIVFTTVAAHGFSMKPLAQALGLVSSREPGILVVGASPWAQALAETLTELKVPVIIADTDWHRLGPARRAGLATYYGEILSEVLDNHLELNAYGYLIAATDNDAYNALVCTDLGPEVGRQNVFQTGRHEGHGDPLQRSHTLAGRSLTRAGADFDLLQGRLAAGWHFQKTTLRDDYGLDAYRAERPEETEILLVRKADGRIVFTGGDLRNHADSGDTLVAMVPPDVHSPTAKAQRRNQSKG